MGLLAFMSGNSYASITGDVPIRHLACPTVPQSSTNPWPPVLSLITDSRAGVLRDGVDREYLGSREIGGKARFLLRRNLHKAGTGYAKECLGKFEYTLNVGSLTHTLKSGSMTSYINDLCKKGTAREPGSAIPEVTPNQ